MVTQSQLCSCNKNFAVKVAGISAETCRWTLWVKYITEY